MKHRCLSPALLALTAAAALAGTPLDPKGYKEGPIAEPVALNVFRLRSSYTFESDFDRGQNARGDSWWNSVEFGRRIPLDLDWAAGRGGQWFFRYGFEYDRFDFDNRGNLPLPDDLQSIAAVLALEYVVHHEVGILFETSPGFYFENDIRGDAFDAPTKLAAAFPLTENFYLVGGISYSHLRNYQWLPILGVYWRINDQWTLRAVVPEPRIIYRPQENLAFFAGGEVVGGSFRTDGDTGRPGRLQHAALTYSEWRAGGGVAWGDPDRCVFELGGGYAFSRVYDYARAGDVFNTKEGAPYVRATFRAAF